jgi:thiol:disulfide interchange protein DsbA
LRCERFPAVAQADMMPEMNCRKQFGAVQMSVSKMYSMRRTAVMVGIATLALSLFSTARAQLVAGTDYRVIQPAQLTADKNKIEVLEFFSYGCHSCNDFHPFLTPWEAKLPGDVVLVRVPMSLGHKQWEPLVRAYYALQLSGDFKRLDKPLFDVIHKQRRDMTTDEQIVKWVSQQGVDGAKFASLMKSFSVMSKAAEAETMARRYKINGTPSIVVDGKYLLTTRKTFAEWPALMDQLVIKARADKQAAKR